MFVRNDAYPGWSATYGPLDKPGFRFLQVEENDGIHDRNAIGVEKHNLLKRRKEQG
jgi:hypothetical protein